MRNSTTIMLPIERRDQLKAIGEALGLSITETIGHLIRGEIAKGTIPNALPGIAVIVNGDIVSIGFSDQKPIDLPSDEARAFADELQTYASRKGGLLNVDGSYEISRAGQAVKVVLDGQEPRTFTDDVALDFARIVREAAA